MLYRPYAPRDFPQLYAIEELCFQPPARFSRRYMRWLIDQPNAAAWIAEEDQKLAGFAIVEWTREQAGIAAYIQTLEVVPELRGRGIGGELLRRLEASAVAAGAQAIGLHVDAENAAAIRLYASHGYLRQGREENYYGQGRAALIYIKPFPPTCPPPACSG